MSAVNPADVAQYLRDMAKAGAVDATEATILEAAANIVLITVRKALEGGEPSST